MSKKTNLKNAKKINRLKELSKISEKPNAKYTIGGTKYKVDKAGTAVTTSDGYIFPTKKGSKYVKKARKNGIKMNYTDPTYGEGTFSRSSKKKKK